MRRAHTHAQRVRAHAQGMYFTGDGCRRDEDGYYWITGRVDDVLNVSGHRWELGDCWGVPGVMEM